MVGTAYPREGDLLLREPLDGVDVAHRLFALCNAQYNKKSHTQVLM